MVPSSKALELVRGMDGHANWAAWTLGRVRAAHHWERAVPDLVLELKCKAGRRLCALALPGELCATPSVSSQ